MQQAMGATQGKPERMRGAVRMRGGHAGFPPVRFEQTPRTLGQALGPREGCGAHPVVEDGHRGKELLVDVVDAEVQMCTHDLQMRVHRVQGRPIASADRGHLSLFIGGNHCERIRGRIFNGEV